MALRDELHRRIDALTEGDLSSVADFVGYLEAKREREAVQLEPTEEDRDWLDADLSRLGEFEPYEWGEEGPPKGKPVIWDPESGSFIVEGGKSEPR